MIRASPDLVRMTMPSLYIPHGGGPCFFMDDPQGMWTGMEHFLRSLPNILPERPRAILIVTGHWETDGFRLTGAARPDLLFDYYGFPEHTYRLRYPVPGDPALAERAAGLLRSAGLDGAVDGDRGLDHGAFVPLMVAFPEADIPVVEMSLDRSLDPLLAARAGAALQPLRDEGVLIVGAGMSFHNMQAYRQSTAAEPSRLFDDWLVDSVEAAPEGRAERLAGWAEAPAGRYAHPREEHLLPLMVAAGASQGRGNKIYGEPVLGTMISGFRFD